MTLLSHPQVREAFAALAREVLNRGGAAEAEMEAEQALLAAILAAVGEGEEGLDFEAATAEANTAYLASGGRRGVSTPAYERALDRQHKARMGALRQEIATLRERVAELEVNARREALADIWELWDSGSWTLDSWERSLHQLKKEYAP